MLALIIRKKGKQGVLTNPNASYVTYVFPCKCGLTRVRAKVLPIRGSITEPTVAVASMT